MGFLLWQTTIIWQRQIKKALEVYDISHAQFVILAITLWLEEHSQNTTQIAIASWSKLDKMTVSKSLKKLMVQGLVNRVEHKTDTRAKNVSLTKKGKHLIHRLVVIVEKIDEQFFGHLSHQNQNSFHRTLKLLVAEKNDE